MSKSRPKKPVPAPTPRVTERWPAIVVALSALVASFMCVFNALTHDDRGLIAYDGRIRGTAPFLDILTQPYWIPPFDPDLYRPLETAMLAFQFALGDGSPVVFRVVSIALYVAATLGVFYLARRLVGIRVALVVSVIFAVHPVHVEAVTLAVAQNELLIALCTTLAVGIYVDRRRSRGTVGARAWIALALLYVVSALAKEQGLLLPAFLIAAELTLVPGPSPRERRAAVAPGLTCLAGIGALVLAARTAVLGGQLHPPVIAEALRGASVGTRFFTFLRVVSEWMRLTLWPVHLRMDYGFSEIVPSTHVGLLELTGIASIVALAAAAWRARRAAPAITFGIVWFALAVFPVSNLLVPTGIILAERTLFLPSVGAIIAIGGAIAWAQSTWSAYFARISPRLLTACMAVIVASALARDVSRERVWRNSETLIVASTRDDSLSWHVWEGYGDMLYGAGLRAAGDSAYAKALRLSLDRWPVRNRYAAHLRGAGMDSAALQQLELSLAESPNQVGAVAQLPPTLIALGRYQEAEHIADSVIAVEHAPPVMVYMRQVADSAMRAHAPVGSVRIGLRAQQGP